MTATSQSDRGHSKLVLAHTAAGVHRGSLMQVLDLFKAADKYDVPGLVKECVQMFHTITACDDVAPLLQVSAVPQPASPSFQPFHPMHWHPLVNDPVHAWDRNYLSALGAII